MHFSDFSLDKDHRHLLNASAFRSSLAVVSVLSGVRALPGFHLHTVCCINNVPWAF